MPSYTGFRPLTGGVAVAALLLVAPAVAQQTIEFVYPIPVYIGPAAWEQYHSVLPDLLGGLPYSDLAQMMPKYFYRPFDDLTPRPGADALSMGGAFVSRSQGAMAMGWNPAALALLRERSLAFDGFTQSSTGTMKREELPDTIVVEGQPAFQILSYTDRRGNVSGFGFAGVAGPLVYLGGRPLVGGVCYRRHVEVSYGTETLFEMGLAEGTGYPFIYGADNRERGAIYSYNASLAYQPIETGAVGLSVGATLCILDGRLRGEETDRINVRGFRPGVIDFRTDYEAWSVELGGLLRAGELVHLGGWLSLPYDLKARNGGYRALGLGSPEAPAQYRLQAEIADYDLEIPLLVSGGITVGPFKGITASADINYRPWSETEIRYDDQVMIPLRTGEEVPLSIFDGPYPMQDVTSFHAGVEFAFPLFRGAIRAKGMELMTHAGYRNLPLSMSEVDLVGSEDQEPYYFGDQVTGDALSFGLSLDTGIGLFFHGGVEVQSLKYRKWFLDSTAAHDDEARGLTFSDEYDRACTVETTHTTLRFSTETRF